MKNNLSKNNLSASFKSGTSNNKSSFMNCHASFLGSSAKFAPHHFDMLALDPP
jgi:hypothetical protein